MRFTGGGSGEDGFGYITLPQYTATHLENVASGGFNDNTVNRFLTVSPTGKVEYGPGGRNFMQKHDFGTITWDSGVDLVLGEAPAAGDDLFDTFYEGSITGQNTSDNTTFAISDILTSSFYPGDEFMVSLKIFSAGSGTSNYVTKCTIGGVEETVAIRAQGGGQLTTTSSDDNKLIVGKLMYFKRAVDDYGLIPAGPWFKSSGTS